MYLLLLIPFVSLCGIVFIKYHDQRWRDRQRLTFRLSFPAELDGAQVMEWLRAISATLRYAPTRLHGVPTIAFEMWATDKGLVHRVKVPLGHEEYVNGQMRGHISGIKIERETEYPRRIWTRSLEAGLTNSDRQLRISSPDKLALTLLNSVQALKEGEAVVIQWVMTPAIPRHPPEYRGRSKLAPPVTHDEVYDQRHKLAQPNFHGVLRIAAAAKTKARADQLIFRVKAALASARAPSTRFRKRVMLTRGELQRRIDDSTTPVVLPIQISLEEAAGLIAWPIGNPLVGGLPPPTSRRLPASDAVPAAGLVIGHSNFDGHERPIAIGFEEALMHTHVLGSTGVGKSVLLGHMARQIMEHGFGLILMETEGNLYQSVLDYVPTNRVQDVVLLDVNDRMHPVGFNVLDQGNPMAVIDQIIDLFMHRFGKDGMGVWAQEYIYHGLRTIAASPDLSFTDLATILNPRTTQEIDWVDSLSRSLTDPELRRWWQRHDNRDRKQQQQRADPVLSRIWQLTSRPELRYIMGQSKSTFKIADLLKENKILLVNLKGVSKDTASLTGTLLMNAIWQATKAVQKSVPTYLILDEFADFMDLPIDTESMLAQARKHRLGMILANQHMAQLKPAVRDAVLSNARSKVVFQTNGDDSRTIAREFGRFVELGDFTNLQAYEAIARVQVPTGTSNPLTLKTIPPWKKTGHALDVINNSRRLYSRPLSEVREDIEDRHKVVRPEGRKPQVGLDGKWGQ